VMESGTFDDTDVGGCKIERLWHVMMRKIADARD